MVLSQAGKVIDSQASKEFYEDSAVPRKKIVYIEDAGHIIPWDYGWENVVDKIEQFVEE
ncbi:MAG: hypothetical protein GKR87_00820 [Kiritimatiellae bacterium]|nr:hypothetical protein [Kiritimatiellia bacterium]